ERFPTAIRASGIALSVNVGFAIAGLVPAAVNAWSGGVERLPVFAVGALILASVVTLISLGLVSEPRRGLDEEPGTPTVRPQEMERENGTRHAHRVW
ncbi:MAG: hypothetical protein ACRDTT_15195, partial [Pseudonocardiaceae bacterium]